MREMTALIADDAEPMRSLLRSSLRHLGCQVVKEVDNGGAVVEAIAASRPDIVFLDINMPGSNGLAVMQQIVADNLHPYIVIISGDDSVENIQAALYGGAKSFFAKPYKLAKIEQILKDCADCLENAKLISALVADDDPLMRKLLGKVLAQFNCSISFEAEDGKQALASIASYVPDIVFLDIEMPGLSGLETLREIRQKHPNLFTVMVSGHSSIENVKTAIGAGANGFIVKPFAADKVRQVLEKFRTARAKP